jgi:hypothetical protein
MEDKLFELINQGQLKCVDCKDCDYAGKEFCGNRKLVDYLIDNGVTISDPLKAGKEFVSRNYEAEYHELHEKHSRFYANYQAMESEFARMRAQLDIVYLIFGKR